MLPAEAEPDCRDSEARMSAATRRVSLLTSLLTAALQPVVEMKDAAGRLSLETSLPVTVMPLYQVCNTFRREM